MSLKPRDEIYITLPSNVPCAACEKNLPADYETILPTPLVLNGEWEVALLECHYFHDWSNLSSTDLCFLVNDEQVQNDQPMADAPVQAVGGVTSSKGRGGTVPHLAPEAAEDEEEKAEREEFNRVFEKLPHDSEPAQLFLSRFKAAKQERRAKKLKVKEDAEDAEYERLLEENRNDIEV